MMAAAMLVAMCLAAPGCVTRPAEQDTAWRRTNLYCGRLIAGENRVVTAEEWETFLEEHVVPFVEGMTVFEAQGRWRDETGTTIKEPTWVLTLLYPKEEMPARLELIDRIARAYADRFKQSAVLVEHEATTVAFVTRE